MNVRTLLGLTTLMLNLCISGFAQIQPRDIMPGIQLSAFYQKTDQTPNSYGAQSGEIGLLYSTASVMYALDSNNAIGFLAGFNYESSSTTLNPYGSPIGGRTGFGFFYQRTKPIINRLCVFLNAGAYYSIGDMAETISDDNPAQGFSIVARPGLYYFITKRTALETTLGNVGYYYMDTGVSGLEEADVITNAFVASFQWWAIQYGFRFRF